MVYMLCFIVQSELCLIPNLGRHRITSGFYEVLATVVACQHGTVTLQYTWFRFFWNLLICSNCCDSFAEFAISFLDFSL